MTSFRSSRSVGEFVEDRRQDENHTLCSRLAEIEAGLDETYFLWSGPTTHAAGKNGSSYYRIQGPKVVIEFSPQGVGGDPTNHVHTVYRDPINDYGHTW